MPRYYEFEVSLVGIEPRIWRRMMLPSASKFLHLHWAIQQAFGWEECHLWEFQKPGRRAESIAGVPLDGGMGEDPPDARKVTLPSYFGGKTGKKSCFYLYDFGDDWEHEVKLVGVHSLDEKFRRRLLGGERAGPPEDCGGPWGYQRMVHFIETGEDPEGDEYVDLGEWLGDWRPGDFELAAAKAAFDS